MGESKAGNGSKKSLLIAVGVLVLIALAVVTVLVFSGSSDEPEPGDNGQMSEFDQQNDESSFDLRRQLAVEQMLDQYELVVNATAEDVSWEEYFIELDAFIRDLETLKDVDPNPTISEGLELFVEARTTYGAAINIDDPEAEIDEDGVAKAGEIIANAQAKVNDYLDEIGFTQQQ